MSPSKLYTKFRTFERPAASVTENPNYQHLPHKSDFLPKTVWGWKIWDTILDHHCFDGDPLLQPRARNDVRAQMLYDAEIRNSRPQQISNEQWVEKGPTTSSHSVLRCDTVNPYSHYPSPYFAKSPLLCFELPLRLDTHRVRNRQTPYPHRREELWKDIVLAARTEFVTELRRLYGHLQGAPEIQVNFHEAYFVIILQGRRVLKTRAVLYAREHLFRIVAKVVGQQGLEVRPSPDHPVARGPPPLSALYTSSFSASGPSPAALQVMNPVFRQPAPNYVQGTGAPQSRNMPAVAPGPGSPPHPRPQAPGAAPTSKPANSVGPPKVTEKTTSKPKQGGSGLPPPAKPTRPATTPQARPSAHAPSTAASSSKTSHAVSGTEKVVKNKSTAGSKQGGQGQSQVVRVQVATGGQQAHLGHGVSPAASTSKLINTKPAQSTSAKTTVPPPSQPRGQVGSTKDANAKQISSKAAETSEPGGSACHPLSSQLASSSAVAGSRTPEQSPLMVYDTSAPDDPNNHASSTSDRPQEVSDPPASAGTKRKHAKSSTPVPEPPRSSSAMSLDGNTDHEAERAYNSGLDLSDAPTRKRRKSGKGKRVACIDPEDDNEAEEARVDNGRSDSSASSGDASGSTGSQSPPKKEHKQPYPFGPRITYGLDARDMQRSAENMKLQIINRAAVSISRRHFMVVTKRGDLLQAAKRPSYDDRGVQRSRFMYDANVNPRDIAEMAYLPGTKWCVAGLGHEDRESGAAVLIDTTWSAATSEHPSPYISLGKRPHAALHPSTSVFVKGFDIPALCPASPTGVSASSFAFFSAGADRKIFFWDGSMDSEVPLVKLSPLREVIHTAPISGIGRVNETLISTGLDKRLVLYSMSKHVPVFSNSISLAESITTLSLVKTGDDNKFAVEYLSPSQQVAILDLRTLSQAKPTVMTLSTTLSGKGSKSPTLLTKGSFSPDGQHYGIAIGDQLHLWDLRMSATPYHVSPVVNVSPPPLSPMLGLDWYDDTEIALLSRANLQMRGLAMMKLPKRPISLH